MAGIEAEAVLPLRVGDGVRSQLDERDSGSMADGAVVGSAIVDEIGRGKSPAEVLAFVQSLADGAHSA